mmetsp:Transcript_15467/g.21538  ORF Transcript_15467/g.21538 Transcript_15467/m.21538 type:complete len:282 (-) Transcript_15467:394-1239(-)
MIMLKIKWKDGLFSWEDSKNISIDSLKKFEDNVILSFDKNNNNLQKLMLNNSQFIPFIVNEQQRNINHFSPILKDPVLINIVSKIGSSLDFPDFQNRSPIDIALNYDQLDLLKMYLSSTETLNYDVNNYRKYLILCKTKGINIFSESQFQNESSQYRYIKILKMIYGWFYKTLYNTNFDYAFEKNKIIYLLFNNDEPINTNLWTTSDSIENSFLLKSMKNLDILYDYIIISRRKKNNENYFLIYDEKLNNRIWVIAPENSKKLYNSEFKIKKKLLSRALLI